MRVRRKGWKLFKWERVVAVPECPTISPFHLLQRYVAVTRRQGKPGGPVFLSLRPPFRALSADTIGAKTRKFMAQYGVDPRFWGAHSTWGAGVLLCKKLGLSAEEVCELGKWKGVNAFVAHYQRLGAQSALAEKLAAIVHNGTSLGQSAESDMSRTPPRFTDRGGRDIEDEAQRPSEPTRPTQKRKRSAGRGVVGQPDAGPLRRRRAGVRQPTSARCGIKEEEA